MVAKLSSVRIITAASFDTSVPVMPIATPMSAFLRAGASFTPSPVMATMFDWPWSVLTRRILSSGDTRATTPMSSSSAISCSSLMAANSAPVSALPVMPSSWPIARGGHGVVAGDHAHLDAGTVALLDGHLRLGAGRVDDADHRQQGEVADVVEVRRGRVERRRVEVAAGHHHHALAPSGHPVVLVECQTMALVVDRGRGAVGRPERAGAVEEHVGGALDEAADDVAGPGRRSSGGTWP